MYRINPLYRPVLIIVDEVVAKMASEGVPDIRILQNSIEVAEEKYIVSVLGREFYEDFISKKNVTITADNQAQMLGKINISLTASGQKIITADDIPLGTIINSIEECSEDYKALWFRYLWKICAEAVDAMATVPGWLRHTAQGQQKHNPAGFTTDAKIATGSRDDVQYKLDVIIQGRLSPLVDGFNAYIVANKEKYPLHPLVKEVACANGYTSNARKAGIVLNVYNDEE